MRRKAAVTVDARTLGVLQKRIEGRGDYKTFIGHLKRASKGLAPILGGAFGGQASQYITGNRAVGSKLGRNLGMKFSQVTGWGDYNITSNTLIEPHDVPKFGVGSIRVTHKEYLGNILGSEDYNSTIYRLNPGISDSFPWLAGLARNFQQYRFNGMIFEFISTSAFALNSTNSALGKVVLATNYNSEDEPFTSTVGMLSTEFSNYGRPAESISHAIECAPQESFSEILYTRTDVEEKGKDLRFTDLGFTQISTEGMQSGSEVGGLWVTYDVTLIKPIINNDINLDVGVDQFIVETNTDDMYAGVVTNRNNVLSGTLSLPDGKVAQYDFNQGVSTGKYWVVEEYEVPASIVGSIVRNGVNPSFVGNNCEVVMDTDSNGPNNLLYFNPGSNSGITEYPNSVETKTAVLGLRTYMVNVTGPRPYFTTAGYDFSGGVCFWRMTITPVSYNTTPQVLGPAPV